VKIGAGFFVNVSELAARNGRLSELFVKLKRRLNFLDESTSLVISSAVIP